MAGSCGRRAEAIRAAVALCGNPNVGKSTLFNALTGLKQHTGNWTGKTVETAKGVFTYAGVAYELVDLPGCYSLDAASPEELVAREFILSGAAACTVIVCDATSLERSLFIAQQVLSLTKRAVVCLNYFEEAKRRGMLIDTKRLEKMLGVEVVTVSRIRRSELALLCGAIERCIEGKNSEGSYLLSGDHISENLFLGEGKQNSAAIWISAERIAAACCEKDADAVSAKRLKLDRLLTGKVSGRLAVLLLLALVLYITTVGANYPSELLSRGSQWLLENIRHGMTAAGIAPKLISAVCDGMLLTLFTVISVMLPPMAIFFPMFTLLEDFGFLPRMAFNLDRCFCRCGSCGKQMLTMCMGLGCNAVGVTGCRIIGDRRERLAAILTNALIPCNGRFPALAALITVLLIMVGAGNTGGVLSGLFMLALLLLAFIMTLGTTYLLTRTVLRGRSKAFVLELPPFRKPRIMQVIVRSVFDRTLKVLARAAAAAAPAGLLIWLLGEYGLLESCVSFLDPIGRVFGLDGCILMAFILGLPANELILPLTLMIYTGQSRIAGVTAIGSLAGVTAAHGWTWVTALCMMLLMLFHSPCATTLLTIKRETHSIKWTALTLLLPNLLGLMLCIAVKGVSML